MTKFKLNQRHFVKIIQVHALPVGLTVDVSEFELPMNVRNKQCLQPEEGTKGSGSRTQMHDNVWFAKSDLSR